MGKYLFCLIGAFLCCKDVAGQSYGLRFSSHEVVPEKRTSLDLTPRDPVCLQDGADISFDLMFTPHLETYFGYVIRLITDQQQNIDLVYNQKARNFTFVIGETSSVVSIDSSRLYREWNHISIRLDEQKQEARLYVNERLAGKNTLHLGNKTCCRIYFGANSFERFQTLDLPPMCIKDIRIKDKGHLKYYYPLSESAGTRCQDVEGHHTAAVSNPIWLKPRHQQWETAQAFNTAGTPSVAFDDKNERLYVVGADSLYTYSLKHSALSGTALARSKGALPAGNQSVFDAGGGQLYNFYIDEKKVSRYDSATRKWDVHFDGQGLTEYWQANKFYTPADTALYIIGGYGQLQYKKLVQRYSFANKHWEIISPAGDAFMPRYQAALGTNAAKDTAYIIGGYGSNTGNQTVNPKHVYDLMAYSVKDRSFKKLYQLPEPGSQFCFANSLVIDTATHEYYALIYPTDKFNSSLQLIKGSLQAPAYQLMGETIPYSFHDIRSFADLYYAADSKKLIAVTLFNEKDNRTNVKIYTLDFPPNPVATIPTPTSGKPYGWLLWGALALLAAGVSVFVLRRKKQRVPVPKQVVATTAPQPAPEPLITAPDIPARETAAVYLFGQFEVFDKNGQDITKLFTPLLKELFLLILVYTIKDGKGISSERLYEILWNDKPLKDAKNNYSVNIVKLRAILEKTGDCHIGKESGKWKLEVVNDSIYIDYGQYMQLAGAKPAVDAAYVQTLLHIVQRGAFLRNVQYEWLDDIKASVSSYVIDSLLQYMATANMAVEAEFMIKLANCIFFFDNLNEEALAYKSKCLVLLGRHGMAKDAYLRFAKEYKESYGQEFERSFREMT